MRLIVTDRSENCRNSATHMLRLVLFKHEVYRFPSASRGVKVLSGVAWVTNDSKDILLRDGEEVCFAPGKVLALVSALDNTPLILEVWGDNFSTSPGTLTTPPQRWQNTLVA